MNILETKDISVSYYKKTILKNIDLTIKSGEITALIGPNGSGKSTLLKTLAGFLKPQSGRIHFKDKDITNFDIKTRVLNLGIGYLIQGGEVYKDMSVYENLLIGGHNYKKDTLKQKIMEIYSIFPSLEKLSQKRAGLLSGGEKQMLAIGVILMQEPELLLLDEPSAGLSPLLVSKILDIVKEINRQKKITILIVEQNIREVLEISDTVYMLREGEIIAKEDAKNLKSNIEKIYDLFFK